MISYGFALTPEKHSAESFSQVFRNICGDGVCRFGGEFTVSVEGMSISLSGGFGLVCGYWLLSDETERLTIPAASNYNDRVDGIAVYVDYGQRRASLKVMEDIDLDAIDKGMIYTADGCGLILYTIRVRRGATGIEPGNILDRRQFIPSLSQLSKDGLKVYNFLQTGFDSWVEAILERSRQEVLRGEQAVKDLDNQISAAGKGPGIGELRISLQEPEPKAQWLLCDGGRVPPEYPELWKMLKGKLPKVSISALGTREKQGYIYGGRPQPLEEIAVPYVPIDSERYVTADNKTLCVMR